MNVAIVGNGILGLTLAFRLVTNHGVKVTIIGPSDRNGGASPAAGAMLNSFAEITDGSLDSEISLQHFGMSYLATQMWPDFERQIIENAGSLLPIGCSKCQGISGGCFGFGTYVVNNTRASILEDKNFQSIRDSLHNFNYQFTDVDPASIPNYNPDMLHRAQKAIYIPNEGWINPKLFIEKLDRFLSASANVTYENCRAIDVQEDSAGLSCIKLENGKAISADHYVFATGVHSRELLKNTSIGKSVQPIYASVGVSIEIKIPPHLKHTHVIRTPNRGGACGIYTVPYYKGLGDTGNNVLIGASNVVVRDPRTQGRIVSIAHLMHAAIKEINQEFHNAEFVCANVGNRPTSLDQYPLLGPIRGTNVSMITGTKRDGFHLSPLISKMLAESIVEGKTTPELEIFRPDRLPIKDLTRCESIEQIVASKIDEAVQHGFVPSSIYQLDQIRSDWIRKGVELHDKYGALEWGIPSQLFNIFSSGIDDPTVSSEELDWLKRSLN